MKRIAILSDTHGLLRDEVRERLAGADVILHGGDVDTPGIIEAMRELGETYVVRGNNDKEWAGGLPQSLAVTIEGVRFFLVHKKKDVPQDLKDVDVVVYCGSTREAAAGGALIWSSPCASWRRIRGSTASKRS